MKESSEQFVYKHITKLPWIAVGIWTALLTWGFLSIPVDNFTSSFVRLFLFGWSWWFLFGVIDERVATRFRRKILFRTREIRNAFIRDLLEDAGVNPDADEE